MTVLIGVTVGIVAGYVGGSTDTVLMRVTDFFLVLPTFVLALILAPIVLELIGAGAQIGGMRATLFVIVIVIGVTSWASTARIIRRQALSLKERAFVSRARVIGASGSHIMTHHILPNVLNLIVANTVLVFAGAILTETVLAFVGLGDPFDPSWGQILSAAESVGAPGLGAWWYIVPPSACVVLVVLSFTLVGSASTLLGRTPLEESRRHPRRRPDAERRRILSAVAASGRCPSRPTPMRRCSWSRTSAPTSSSSPAP